MKHLLKFNESAVIDPTYTHFALYKIGPHVNKIVDGWEYNKDTSDAESIKYDCTRDLKNNYSPEIPENQINKTFKISTLRALRKQGIDPFDSVNWLKDY